MGKISKSGCILSTEFYTVIVKCKIYCNILGTVKTTWLSLQYNPSSPIHSSTFIRIMRKLRPWSRDTFLIQDRDSCPDPFLIQVWDSCPGPFLIQVWDSCLNPFLNRGLIPGPILNKGDNSFWMRRAHVVLVFRLWRA